MRAPRTKNPGQAEQAVRLVRAGTAIASAGTPAATAQALADALHAALGWPVSVYLLAGAAEALSLAAEAGQSGEPASLPLNGTGILPRAAIVGEVMVSDAGRQAGALAGIPLRHDAETVGVIGVSAPTADAFSGPLQAALGDLAALVARHLARASAVEVSPSSAAIARLQKAYEEAIVIQSTSQSLAGVSTADELYEIALAELARLGEADGVTLYLAGPDPREGVEWVEQAAQWRDGRVTVSAKPERYPIERAPVFSQFPQSRANLIFNDAPQNPRLDAATRQVFAQQGAGSALVIPFSTGITWLGAAVFTSQAAEGFDETRADACRRLADVAALAFDRFMMVERSRQQLSLEQSVRAVVDAVHTASTLSEIEQTAEEGLARLLNRPRSVIHAARQGSPGSLSLDELQAIAAVEQQVVLAKGNVTLLNRTQRAMHREQFMGEMTSTLQRKTTVDDVLESAAAALSRVLEDYEVTLRLTPDGGADDAEGRAQ